MWDTVLVDGHNRYAICTKHGIAFSTVEKEFECRDDVLDWIDANQLGRRNLSPDHFTLLLGRRYNRMKKSKGAPTGNTNAEKQIAQNDPFVSTADKLAIEHHVSPATVKRAGKAAADFEVFPDEVKALAAAGDVSIHLASQFVELPPEAQQEARHCLFDGGEGIRVPRRCARLDRRQPVRPP